MAYNDDKIELLKLKQGLIDENEPADGKKERVYEMPRGSKAIISNYWYHYKWHTIGTIAFALLITFFLKDILSITRPDVNFLGISTRSDTTYELTIQREYIMELLALVSPDFNEDGKNQTSFSLIDLSFDEQYSDPNYLLANRTKLAGAIQDTTSLLFIGNKLALENLTDDIPPSEIYVDLAEKYPDCDSIEDEYFFKIKGSDFHMKTEWEDCPEDLYIALRGPFTEEGYYKEKTFIQQERALIVLDNIINAKL